MPWVRAILVGVVLVTALLIQLVALPLLHLPGATPDLLLVTVVALGLAGGTSRGASAGFAAGLLLDLAPPADGVLGMSAVVLTVVGYLAGMLGERPDRPAVATIALVGLLAGGAVLALALLGGVVADPRISWDRLPGLVLTQALYACVLAAFIVPGIAALIRRVEPVAPRYEIGRYER